MLGLAGARPNLPSIWCPAQWRVGRISASVIRRIAASSRRRRVTAKTPDLARPLLRPHPEEVQRRHVCLRCTVSKDGGGPDRGGLVLRDASRRDIVHRYGCAGLHAAMLLSTRQREAALPNPPYLLRFELRPWPGSNSTVAAAATVHLCPQYPQYRP